MNLCNRLISASDDEVRAVIVTCVNAVLLRLFFLFRKFCSAKGEGMEEEGGTEMEPETEEDASGTPQWLLLLLLMLLLFLLLVLLLFLWTEVYRAKLCPNTPPSSQ